MNRQRRAESSSLPPRTCRLGLLRRVAPSKLSTGSVAAKGPQMSTTKFSEWRSLTMPMTDSSTAGMYLQDMAQQFLTCSSPRPTILTSPACTCFTPTAGSARGNAVSGKAAAAQAICRLIPPAVHCLCATCTWFTAVFSATFWTALLPRTSQPWSCAGCLTWW